MKRTVLIFIVAALVLITCILWFFSGGSNAKPGNLLQFGVIIIVVAFAVFLGFKRFSSAKRGEPAGYDLFQ